MTSAVVSRNPMSIIVFKLRCRQFPVEKNSLYIEKSLMDFIVLEMKTEKRITEVITHKLIEMGLTIMTVEAIRMTTKLRD